MALTQERRHELNAEFSLYFDLCRMGLAEEWFRCEYPKTKANSTPEECWETGDSFRYFEHQKYQEIFPIPTNEILNNPLINRRTRMRDIDDSKIVLRIDNYIVLLF